MKTYELTYLISPEISEKDIEVLQEKIKSLIQEGKGSVSRVGRLTKKKLYYPIKNNEEAFLADLAFLLEPAKLAGLEKKLKVEKQIIRYLISIKPLPKKPKKIRVKPKKLLEPKVKVELKEIEKKLEEILGE